MNLPPIPEGYRLVDAEAFAGHVRRYQLGGNIKPCLDAKSSTVLDSIGIRRLGYFEQRLEQEHRVAQMELDEAPRKVLDAMLPGMPTDRMTDHDALALACWRLAMDRIAEKGL